MTKPGWALLCLFFAAQAKPAQIPEPAGAKFAQSRNGMVATGSSYATQAGVKMLAAGGNAVDAAAAAWFAITVTDPANASLGGRVQMMVYLRGGRVLAIDGATESPASVPRLTADSEDRSGYAIVPVPGGPASIAELVQKYGRLKLADAIQPAIELAERGFVIPSRLAATWKQARAALATNPGAAKNFLKPDGSPWQAGELFCQPVLAGVLRRIAEQGIDSFYSGEIADAMARDVAGNGGYLQKSDLQNYRPRPGVVVRSSYRGFQIASAGGRAWGNTLSEMLNILGHFQIKKEPAADEIELLARIMAQAMEDRPQEIGTLKAKPGGYPLPVISSPDFAAQRAEMIRHKLLPAKQTTTPHKLHDTTHLSIMDAEGNAVSLTTSIGPSFGARVVTPKLGFLYAHSYKMRSDPTPKTRDLTEMTPTIVLRDGQPLLVVGAAGSERIPTAIFQVIVNVLDRGWSLQQAIVSPRIFCLNEKLRLHYGFTDATIEALRARGFEIEMVALDAPRHQGLVHAVQFDPRTKWFHGAADLGGNGSAAAPPQSRKEPTPLAKLPVSRFPLCGRVGPRNVTASLSQNRT